MTLFSAQRLRSVANVSILLTTFLFLSGCTAPVQVTVRNYTDYKGPVSVAVNGKTKGVVTLNGKKSMETLRLQPLKNRTHEITVKSADGAHGSAIIKTSGKPKYVMAVRDPQRPTGFGFLVSESPLRF